MQPVHLNAVGPNWNERLGPERAARAFRMRDLLDAGAPLTLGSDWPVGDADPRLGMIAARRHGLTGEEALAGYTLAPARAVGEAGGRIRVGLRADLTGMAEDPVHAPDAPVWLTVVAGRVVHHYGRGAAPHAGGGSGSVRRRSISSRRTRTRLISCDIPPASASRRVSRSSPRARSTSPRAISISAYSRRISATTGRSPQAALRSSPRSKWSSARARSPSAALSRARKRCVEPRLAAWLICTSFSLCGSSSRYRTGACSRSPISAHVSPSSAIAVNQNRSRGIAANSSVASSRNWATPACVLPDIRCAIGRIARQAYSAGFSVT